MSSDAPLFSLTFDASPLNPGAFPWIFPVPLIVNGEEEDVIDRIQIASLPGSVDLIDFQLVALETIDYSIAATSSMPEVLPHPQLSIPLEGTFQASLLPNFFAASFNCLTEDFVDVETTFDLTMDSETYTWKIYKNCEPTELPQLCGDGTIPASNYTGNNDSVPLKVGSYNIRGFRGDISGGGDLTAGTTRSELIGPVLAQADHDVLAIQEVWSAEVRKNLEQSLESAYPYRIASGLSSSGLYVASRIPITSCSFTPFLTAANVDLVSMKGFVTVTLDLGDGLAAAVINTHAQSGSGEEEVEARAPQLERLGEAVGALVRAGVNPVLVGDLNVHQYQSSVDATTPASELVEPQEYLGLRSLWDEAWGGFNVYAATIDIEGTVLSDHATGLGYRVCRGSAIDMGGADVVVDDNGDMCDASALYEESWGVLDYCWGLSSGATPVSASINRMGDDSYLFFREFEDTPEGGVETTVATNYLSDHVFLTCEIALAPISQSPPDEGNNDSVGLGTTILLIGAIILIVLGSWFSCYGCGGNTKSSSTTDGSSGGAVVVFVD